MTKIRQGALLRCISTISPRGTEKLTVDKLYEAIGDEWTGYDGHRLVSVMNDSGSRYHYLASNFELS